MSKKVILGLIVLICFVVVSSGCTSTSDETMNDSDESSSGDSSSTSSAASDLQIRVTYSGSWSGNYATDETGSDGMQKVEGTGTKTFTVTGCKSYITAAFEKSDGGSDTLTAEILENGKVIESKSTSEPFGRLRVRAIKYEDAEGWTGHSP